MERKHSARIEPRTGCSSFRIKVDSNLPIVSDNSWTASVGVTNDLMVDTLLVESGLH